MSNYVIHLAGELIDLVQRCVRCGIVISDYRHAAWPPGQDAPTGFAPGPVTVSASGNPRVTLAGAQSGARSCRPGVEEERPN